MTPNRNDIAEQLYALLGVRPYNRLKEQLKGRLYVQLGDQLWSRLRKEVRT